MNIEALTRRRPPWLPEERPSGIVISSRLRLARNVADTHFPPWSNGAGRKAVWERLAPVLSGLDAMAPCLAVAMEDLSPVEREILRERRLVSVEQSRGGAGAGVVFRRDETASVMVNEEDHLRLQVVRPGLDLEGAWAELDRLDDRIQERVPSAFSDRYGYLTACPTNVGTGLRAGVMMHLPGLCIMNEIDPVLKGLARLGLVVRGMLGEGTEASGSVFQISNQTTLGETEAGILARLLGIVRSIREHEINARTRLVEQRPACLWDHVGRSYGVIRYARLLQSRELLELLSGLRLGVNFGLVKGVDTRQLDELMLLTQPGHLQTIADKDLSPDDRDRFRADFVRGRLSELTLEGQVFS